LPFALAVLELTEHFEEEQGENDIVH
jgi:hypothetical protein